MVFPQTGAPLGDIILTMYDLSAIISAKKKADINQDKLSSNYDDEYKQAIKYLKQFTENPTPENLNKATGKFFDSLKYKRTQVEPYFYIAYACYLFDEKEMAFKYLELAEEVDYNFRNLPALRELLESD